MEEQDKKETEHTENKQVFEIRIKDNKIKIEKNSNEIILKIKGIISNNKFIRKYKYDEIKKVLNLLEYNDIENIYNYLLKCNFEIIEKETKTKIKIILNEEIENNEEEKLTSEQMIKTLIDKIKEIDD